MPEMMLAVVVVLIVLVQAVQSIGDRLATPLGASTAGLLVHAAVLDSLLSAFSFEPRQISRPWWSGSGPS